MRDRGIPAEVVIGYRPAPFFSHAWVEIGGRVANGFSRLPDQIYRCWIAFSVSSCLDLKLTETIKRRKTMYEKPNLNRVGEAQDVILGIAVVGSDIDSSYLPGQNEFAFDEEIEEQ
ncbi:MAG: lasso peptide biosynthesis B2 protein [Ignavibacteriota bacterium]